MAEHLLTLGHKYVGYIATSLKNNQKQRYRCVEGFVETFQGADKNNCVIIKTPDDTEVGGKTEYDIGYRLAQQLINENKKLTAIVGMNDVIALGIYDALEDANYRIPTDMSVMGCDNTLISEIKRISLTTVEHFILCKGMDACEFLLKKVMLREKGVIDSNISSTYHVEYVPRIVIRSTTDHPRKNEK